MQKDEASASGSCWVRRLRLCAGGDLDPVVQLGHWDREIGRIEAENGVMPADQRRDPAIPFSSQQLGIDALGIDQQDLFDAVNASINRDLCQPVVSLGSR